MSYCYPLGAYTANSKGSTYVRQKVNEFIAKRDGLENEELDE